MHNHIQRIQRDWSCKFHLLWFSVNSTLHCNKVIWTKYLPDSWREIYLERFYLSLVPLFQTPKSWGLTEKFRREALHFSLIRKYLLYFWDLLRFKFLLYQEAYKLWESEICQYCMALCFVLIASHLSKQRLLGRNETLALCIFLAAESGTRAKEMKKAWLSHFACNTSPTKSRLFTSVLREISKFFEINSRP